MSLRRRCGVACCLASIVACTTEPVRLKRAGVSGDGSPDVASGRHDAHADVSAKTSDATEEKPAPRPVGCGDKTESFSEPYAEPWPVWCADGANDAAADLLALVARGDSPPDDCVAPCLWDLVKRCLPTGPCTAENRAAVYPYFGGHSGYTVCLGDELCLSYGRGSVPPSGFPSSWGWSDPADQEVAWGFASSSGLPQWTACGATCVPPVPVTDACASQPEYPVNASQPHCVPWEPLLRWLY
jgi:hypothetical protein